MEYHGYAGSILYVDLTSGNIRKEPLDLEMGKKFIGDFGINARLASDLIKPGIDPLSPENVILIGAGPLVGTPVPGGSRFTVLTKYPLTGAIAFASVGMELGRRLKCAGYDHLIITGKAKRPVYLSIFNDNIEICDATHLWGKDILDTTDELWARHGRAYSIMAIGQAGENLAKLALALVDRIASAGKGGLAAVMGAKNLKAIAVNGSKRLKIADLERLREPTKQALRTFKPDLERMEPVDCPELIKSVGKMAFFDTPIARRGGVAYKNWTVIRPAAEIIEKFGSKAYLGRLNRTQSGCLGCPHRCKDIVEVREGVYQGLTAYISSPVGRVRELSVRCGADSIEQVIKLMDIANRYGVCCHIFASVMDLAVDLYERGIISRDDAQGVLKRDFDTAARLMRQIAFRQGIGDVLADGSYGIIRRYGQRCEQYSVHVKGLEPQIDPREARFSTESFAQIVNPEGAAPQAAHSGRIRVGPGFTPQKVRDYCQQLDVPAAAVRRILDVPFGYNVARLLRYSEDLYATMTCLGICSYRSAVLDYHQLAEMYSGATGIEVTPAEIQQAGERVWNMFKLLNVREGFRRKDDRVPPKWLEPLKSATGEDILPMGAGGKPLSAGDIEKMLDDYYAERGWDMKQGIPTREKLAELGLGEFIGMLPST